MDKARRTPMAALVLAAVVVFLPPAADAVPASPRITNKAVVFAPMDATAFGSTIAMDETRLAVRAKTADGPVVYVYDRQGDGTWLSSATVHAPVGATRSWGTFLAINGGTLAVSDPGVLATNERYGVVHLYRRHVNGFKEVQTIFPLGDFTYLRGVWLSGQGLLLNYTPYCDSGCSRGRWQLFTEDNSGTFQPAVDSLDLDPRRGGESISVGVDAGRFVVGNPGYFNITTLEPVDNFLTAYDTSPFAQIHDETTQFADPSTLDVKHGGWYRRVDLSGSVIAHEDCCTNEKQVVILRRSASGYVPKATFPVPSASKGLALLPGVVLLADSGVGGWRTFVEHNGTWSAGSDLAAPSTSAGEFPVEPVAAADRVAVKGVKRVHVLTVTP